MTLRNYGPHKFSKNPSGKVIDDLPNGFSTFRPVRQDSELEVIRKPVSSKIRSKY